VLVLAGLAALVSTASAAPARAARRPLAHAAIVGGTPASIQQFPWQVFLQMSSPDETCGGSILNATTILTAAHCTDPEGTTTPRPASAFLVFAGASDMSRYVPGRPLPSGMQLAHVASVRVHPGYTPTPQPLTDDVAVLTLASPLNLSGANAKPIALAPVGGAPAPGTPLSFSGYGQEAPPAPPDYKLYSATLSATTDDACRSALAPNSSASVLCVPVPTPPSPCFGDSGGALVGPNGQVGVTSYVSNASCGTGFVGFADVTSPEVRAFIDGSATPPVAPRMTAGPVLNGVNPPVVGSPLTCNAGTWNGAPSFSYTFAVDATGQVLASGASPTYTPGAAVKGAGIVCVLQATNAGGTSIARTGTTPPIAADTVRPRSAFRSIRCKANRCAIRLDAADSNSLGHLTVRLSARWSVVGRCKRGHGKHRRVVRCRKTRSKAIKAVALGGVRYKATATKLPYTRVQFRIDTVDAARNHQRKVTTASLTLRKARRHR